MNDVTSFALPVGKASLYYFLFNIVVVVSLFMGNLRIHYSTLSLRGCMASRAKGKRSWGCIGVRFFIHFTLIL